MMFKAAGAANVRSFIASAGLTNTLVPDSTRAFTGYLFGAADYKNLSWEQLQELVKGPVVRPFLNTVQTLASSAEDFISYYSRALQGAFFTHRETLNEFRRVLTLCDFIYLVPLPLGTSAYAKSGNADAPGFHARSIAGGLYVADQWVYFAFIINWYAESGDDPDGRKLLLGHQRVAYAGKVIADEGLADVTAKSVVSDFSSDVIAHREALGIARR